MLYWYYMIVSSSAPSAVDFHNFCQLNESSEIFNQFQLILKLLGGQYQIPGQQYPWMVGPLRPTEKNTTGVAKNDKLLLCLWWCFLVPWVKCGLWRSWRGQQLSYSQKKTKFTWHLKITEISEKESHLNQTSMTLGSNDYCICFKVFHE